MNTHSSSLPVCVPVEDSTVRDLYCSSHVTPASKRKLSSASVSTRTSEGTSSKGAEFNSDLPSTVLPHIPVQATGYCSSLPRDIAYWTIGFFTVGISLLLSSWFNVIALKLRRRRCPIDKCEIILLQTMNGKETPLPLLVRQIKEQDLHLTLSHGTETSGGGGKVSPTTKDAELSSALPQLASASGDGHLDILAFEFLCQHFIFDPWDVRFVNVQFPIEKQLFSKIWSIHGNGVQDETTIESRRQLFGKCEVHIPLKSSFELVVTECLHPFYIFQILSMALWFGDNYYYYASAVLLLSCISLFISIRETIKNNRNLHEMAKFSCPLTALRNPPPRSVRLLNSKQAVGCLQELNSTELVPGDIFALERGMKLPCDCILLVGSALVDESMMTGESKPVYKTSLPHIVSLEDAPLKDRPFSFKRHHKHVLYGGSEIRDSGHLGGPALCLVVKTGFSTEQGRMMRSLVHPVGSTRMNFEKETWKFVGLLACMSCFTFVLSLYQGINNGLQPFTVFKRAIDGFTIAVPPALPIIISVGIICAQDALRKNGTTCLAPSRINVAGRTNVIVFDKTGTLTEDDEDLLAVVPSTTFIELTESLSMDEGNNNGGGASCALLADRFPKGIPLNSSASTTTPSTHDASLPHLGLPATSPLQLSSDLLIGLATCHSLSFVDNELIGDPLEYQMFNFTGWKLFPPKTPVHIDVDDDEDDDVTADTEGLSEENENLPTTEFSSLHQSEEAAAAAAVACSDDLDMYISVSPMSDEDHRDHLAGLLQSAAIDISPKSSPSSSNTPKVESNILSSSPLPSVELPTAPNPCYVILRVFEFDPYLQRMSVIVQNRDTLELKVYSKGSPERISQLCHQDSIPHDWDHVLSGHTERGLRVLAVSQKPLIVADGPLTPSAIQHLKREDVEKDMSFLGFLLFTNMLRPDSAAAIRDLQSAGCCCYMATGDGPVTGAAIGFQAGILPEPIEVLVSGVLVDDQLKWKMKPFGASSLSNLLENANSGENGNDDNANDDPALLPSSNMSTHSGLTDDNNKESDSLLRLIQGKCLSKVGLSITGEAFRHLVTASTTISEDLSPLSLDRFEVDAFSSEKKKFASVCMPRKTKSSKSDPSRRWDAKPRAMGTLEFVLRYFQIFSRMSPDDKALLIQELQGLSNYPIVGMCGDGANDCAALKAADVGISLSSKEASVAAPFNCSKQKSIRVVIDVLREGRGALTNSIQNFQFVAVYAMVQLCAVTALNTFATSLTDPQFLYLDLVVVLPLTYFMSWSHSSPTLTRIMPPQSLLAWSIVVSLIGQVLIQVAFQLAALFFVLPVIGSSFYVRFEPDPEDETYFIGFENTVIFLVSNVQTVIAAWILALGTRKFKVIKRNFMFLFAASIFTIIGFALVLNEASYIMWLRNLMLVVSLPLSFRTILLLTISINIVLSFALEEGVIRGILRRMETRRDMKKLNRESLRSAGIDEMVLESSYRCDAVRMKVEED